MQIEIRKDRCKECGLCVISCPKKSISFESQLNAIGYHPVTIDDGCVMCAACYTVCPDGVYQFILGGDDNG